jgi:hypothetical protein
MTKSDDGNSVSPASGSGSEYSLNLSLAHLGVCAVNMWLGYVVTLLGSRSAYAISGSLMLVYVMIYMMSYFWVKACRKMTKRLFGC